MVQFFAPQKVAKDSEAALLLHLPSTFESLPQTLKNQFGGSRPCPDCKRPFTDEAVRSAACRVPIRKGRAAAAGRTQVQLVARRAALEATAGQMVRGSVEGDSRAMSVFLYMYRPMSATARHVSFLGTADVFLGKTVWLLKREPDSFLIFSRELLGMSENVGKM